MKGQALKPDFFNRLPTLLVEESAKKADVSEEEMKLAALSNSGGWFVLEEYIDSLLKDLDQGTESAMAQGLPFEEIGRNAVVINLAKGVINRIKQKVQDGREAVEKHGTEPK